MSIVTTHQHLHLAKSHLTSLFVFYTKHWVLGNRREHLKWIQCLSEQIILSTKQWGWDKGLQSSLVPGLKRASHTSLVRRPAQISPYLVFPFQHQQISDLPKGQSQANNFSLIYVVGQLAYMDHTWRNTRTAHVTFEFFAVVAIGCRGKKQKQIQSGREQKALVLLE